MSDYYQNLNSFKAPDNFKRAWDDNCSIIAAYLKQFIGVEIQGMVDESKNTNYSESFQGN
jgi:hypothetical protein